MLDCKLCNYYESLDTESITTSAKGIAKCELSGYVFMKDAEDLEIQYPCRNISIAEYLKRKQNEDWEHHHYSSKSA